MLTVRCPNCRGAKQVAKLGGMIGECNLCEGKGHILASEKPKPEPYITEQPVREVIDLVAQAVEPVVNRIDQIIEPSNETHVKIDPKRAVYKRKKK